MYLKSYTQEGVQVFTREYSLWNDIIKRCRAKREDYRWYKGCSLSEKFSDFQYFAEWCQRQVGFLSKDEKGLHFNLDKDIIVRGNRIYREDCCVFVPGEVNRFFCTGKAIRGDLPIGVDYQKRWDNYRARCSDGMKSVYLGAFKTPEQAFEKYKSYKESKAKELAEFWKPDVDERVYTALMNYRVEATD